MQWIEEQLDSVLNQQDVDVHVFISVDFSSDGTYEWCQKHAYNNKGFITVLPYGDRFGCAAKNFGRLFLDVDISEFDYVSLCDQDDIWLEDKLTYAVKEISENYLSGFSSDVLCFWDDGRELITDKSQSFVEFDYYFEAAGPGCSYVMKSSEFKSFQDFYRIHKLTIESVPHDTLIYAFFRYNGYSWNISKISKMLYRQHASNQVGLNKGIKAYLARLNRLRDGSYRRESEAIFKVLYRKDFNLSRPFLIFNFLKLRRKKSEAFIFLIFNLFFIF